MDDRPDAKSGETNEDYRGTPRWVKVFGVIAVLLVALVAFIVLSELGGPHGPQRHEAASERLVEAAMNVREAVD